MALYRFRNREAMHKAVHIMSKAASEGLFKLPSYNLPDGWYGSTLEVFRPIDHPDVERLSRILRKMHFKFDLTNT